jgi:hypothetical protein
MSILLDQYAPLYLADIPHADQQDLGGRMAR